MPIISLSFLSFPTVFLVESHFVASCPRPQKSFGWIELFSWAHRVVAWSINERKRRSTSRWPFVLTWVFLLLVFPFFSSEVF